MTVDVARSLRKMFVNGDWVDSESGRHFDAISPATGKITPLSPATVTAPSHGSLGVAVTP